MKKLTSIIILLILTISIFSQNSELHKKFYSLGVVEYNKSNYLEALQNFNEAYKYAANETQKNNSSNYQNKCIFAAQKQQADLKIALKQAEIEKNRADSALDVAIEMQGKVETAMFDKAVKEQFPEWKGYNFYKKTDERLEILNKIDSLDLSNNALLEIPKKISECSNLKHLNLFGNPDIEWKESVQTMKKLNNNVGIYVSIDDLSDIDSSYWQYITGIEILKTGLNQIPKNILEQNQLTYLSIRGRWQNRTYNNFDTLPKDLFDLTNLEILNLEQCNITFIPDGISKLKNLKKLYLYNNKLISLPRDFGKLNIEILSLSENKFEEIPEQVFDIKNLKKFVFRLNNLEEIPVELFQLDNLRELYLSDNKICKVPDEIKNLKKLEILYLSGNKLTSITSQIGVLENLKELSLGENQIQNLPSEIGNLKKLQKLDLRYSGLSSLPSELSNLKSLKFLNLSFCNLEFLPTEICKLENLIELHLYGNDFKNIPSEVENLKKLQVSNFSIYNNEIGSVFFNKLSKNTNLSILTIHSDTLVSIPPEIGKLVNLTFLNLSNNKLVKLPEEISNLKKLKYLNLRGNNFSEEEKEKIESWFEGTNCEIIW